MFGIAILTEIDEEYAKDKLQIIESILAKDISPDKKLKLIKIITDAD